MSKSVIISEPGLWIHVVGGLLHVKRDNNTIARIKPHELDQLILMGNIEISSGAISLLLRNGIDCVFLTQRGRYKGRLVGSFSRNIPLRVKQFEKLGDDEFKVKVAAGIVKAKVSNQRSLLMRTQREIKDKELGNALSRMRVIRDSILQVDDLDKIRGYEGEAANLYFRHFGKCIKNSLFEFYGRNRRPPKDPINACLSFGYTLLGVTVESMIMEVGLDPYLGALHEPAYGRPSLVLDIIEEFRPIVVDALVLRLINRKQLVPDDFGPPERPVTPEDFGVDDDGVLDSVVDNKMKDAVYLKGSGRKIFISSLFGRLRERIYYAPRDGRLTLREIIRQQIYMMARLLKGEVAKYEGFVIK